MSYQVPGMSYTAANYYRTLDKLIMHFLPQLSDFVPLENFFSNSFRAQIG